MDSLFADLNAWQWLALSGLGFVVVACLVYEWWRLRE